MLMTRLTFLFAIIAGGFEMLIFRQNAFKQNTNF